MSQGVSSNKVAFFFIYVSNIFVLPPPLSILLLTRFIHVGGVYALTSGRRGGQPAAAHGDVCAIVPRGAAAVLLSSFLTARIQRAYKLLKGVFCRVYLVCSGTPGYLLEYDQVWYAGIPEDVRGLFTDQVKSRGSGRIGSGQGDLPRPVRF